VASRRLVVQDDEVTHLVELVDLQTVVFLGVGRIERAIREDRSELRDTALDEMNARRLERLQEYPCEAERDQVLVTELATSARRKAQKARLGLRSAVEIREQCGCGLVVTDVAAAVDIPVADSMLQRNSPLPPGRVSQGARERPELARTRAGYGDG